MEQRNDEFCETRFLLHLLNGIFPCQKRIEAQKALPLRQNYLAMIKKITLLFVVALTLNIAAFSQNKNPKTGIVNIADSVQMYQTFLDNAPVEPEFMMVPRFAIVDTKGHFYFSTGARLNFMASFDWGNPITNPTDAGSDLLMPATPGNTRLFQMSAGESLLYFNIIGFPNTKNQIGLFVSLGMDKDSDNSYRIFANQVYMRYRGFQCGYATSLYNDRGADAYTIDGHGPCASGAHKAVQINYQHNIDNWGFGVGVELPQVSYTQMLLDSTIDVPSKTAKTFQRIPDVPLYASYTWENSSHIRLSAVFRDITYYNVVKEANNHVLGWGVKLSGSVHLGPVQIFAMTQGGHAISNYMKDNRNTGIDLVPGKGESPDYLERTYSYGGVLGVQVDLTSAVFMTGSCSYMQNEVPEYEVPATINYQDHVRGALNASANVVWRISRIFSTGVEYVHVRNQKISGDKLYDNRVYAMFMMNF